MDERQVAQLLQEGVARHNAGDLAAAETTYRRILTERPTNADALHLLGVLHGQRGRPDLGLPLIQQAITLNPNFGPFHTHLGDTLSAVGRPVDALDAYGRAVQINPRDVDARHGAGSSLFKVGRIADAIEQFRLAAELSPGDGAKVGNYGYALVQAGRFQEAIPILNRAVQMAPNVHTVWMQLAEAHWRQKDYDAALPPAHRAVTMAPNDSRALVLLGNTLQTLARFPEAADVYSRAMQIDPAAFDAPSNLALVLLKMGRARESLDMYEQVAARWPNAADALANRSLALLTLGRFERGFAEYETRWQTASSGKYRFTAPKWDGSDPHGKTILLMNEQGLGDTVHFVRYATLLAARGARSVVACPPALRELIMTVKGVSEIVEERPTGQPGEIVTLGGGDLRYDCYAPLSSLPHLFKTTLETIPADVPYVAADATRLAHWRHALADDANLKVGLVWAGPPIQLNDRARSMSLQMLAPLTAVEGVTFYSLQKGAPASQASSPPAGMRIVSLGDQLKDFADTAALLDVLDLLISVDTSVVHVAGALARPVWTLVAAGPDWRWMLDRDDSPWYPTMRLFRQAESGQWPPVIDRVASALREFVVSKKESR
jgi:tetratricopeptide (TPR) repeat protein